MPERFGSLEHARAVMAPLLGWYNDDALPHRARAAHAADVHHGRAPAIVAARQVVLDAAHVRHPERFVNGRPIQKSPPPAAWINPPPMDQIAIADRITDRIAITDRITIADRIEEAAAH